MSKNNREWTRFVFAKNKATNAYEIPEHHRESTGVNDFKNAKADITKEFVNWLNQNKVPSSAVFPDCYGLYRRDSGGYYLLRFRYGGYESDLKRGPSIFYEAVLYETDSDETGKNEACRLASLLAPAAWLEPSKAIIEPVDSAKIDVKLRNEIENWLKNPKEPFIFSESPPLSWPIAIFPPQKDEREPPLPSPVCTIAGASTKRDNFYVKICAVLLFFAVASAVWLGFEKMRLERSYNSLHRSYQRLFVENEEMKNQINDPARQLQIEVDRLKDILSEIQNLAGRM